MLTTLRRTTISRQSYRLFSDATKQQRPVRRAVSEEERASLRAARKERATQTLQQITGDGAAAAASAKSAGSASGGGVDSALSRALGSRWIWYAGVGLPAGILVWLFSDENSPPAKACRWIGLTKFISGYTDQIAKPSHAKLLPDWSQIPNVPHDIPTPHTLVLDLEQTLVSSTWDRKYGWRHAKRPGVDKFLHEMAQYYEIVLYSPSIDGVADPVVTSLDKDGCIMHRLYRDATYFKDGVHVKDLNSLNRNVKRMIVLDDDPAEVAFNPENLVRVKPYTDPTDRTDKTLTRITPFLVEIARDGHNDIPAILQQYQGMDADEIADEQDRRVQSLRQERQRRSQQGIGKLLGGGKMNLPEPELPPVEELNIPAASPKQLTAKDIAGQAPTGPGLENTGGLMGWMNRRAQEKEENQMRKMEKWNEILMKKQQQKMAEMEKAKNQAA